MFGKEFWILGVNKFILVVREKKNMVHTEYKWLFFCRKEHRFQGRSEIQVQSLVGLKLAGGW